MLYHFLYPLSHQFPSFNIFRYITFRASMAFLIGGALSIWWGQGLIKWMKKKQFGQIVREDGPEGHLSKAGTPTMGGLFVMGSILATIVICGQLSSIPLLVGLFIGLGYALLGGVDDYLKTLKGNSRGISVKGKLLWQFLGAIGASYGLVELGAIDTKLYVPFFKGPLADLGWAYPLFASLVIVGSSNAVNLTDGLDGLAIGPIMTSATTLLLLTYVAGHKEMANYLLIPYVEGGGELAVLSAAIVGAGAGFLWYNSYPAQVFMGDIGSLSLGGILGVISVISKNEILFVLIGGVFVVEALSVILQVGFYKLTQKRIFKMAPLHHHFELMGWPEPKVIVRFWIVSVFLAIISVATLKMR